MELCGEMKNSLQKGSSNKQLCVTTNDRLSNLPWPIQRHIISFLPMLDAVRVTCLSKKWRTKCHSLPNLIFNYNEFPQLERKLDHFVKFVSQMISLHDESKIDTFRLNIWVNDESYSCNLEWIQFALQRQVKCLTLYTVIGGTQILPSCLFISKSLEKLHLALFLVLRLPTKITLPNLKELCLEWLFLDDVDLTQNFFSSCPLLETLALRGCNLRNLKMLSIYAPKLKYLDISNCRMLNECKINLLTPSLDHFIYDSDVAEEICLKKDSSIHDASIIFQEPGTRVITDSQMNCAVKVLEGLRQTSHLLLLSEWFTEFLFFKGRDPLKNLFASSFGGLDTLKLHMWAEKDHVRKVISLLCMFQGIRELAIIISYEVWPPNMPSLELHSQDLDLVDFANLKYVVVNDFGGQDCVLELMEFLLIKARVLEDMVFPIPDKIDDVILRGKTHVRKHKIIAQKLSKFSRAFPDAPIHFAPWKHTTKKKQRSSFLVEI